MADLYNYYTGKIGGVHELMLELYKDGTIRIEVLDIISKHADELVKKIEEERKKYE